MFREDEHPRESDGKFTDKGAGAGEGEKLRKAVHIYSDEPEKDALFINASSDTYRLPDEIIPRSLSAKWRNYEIVLPNGKTARFAEGSKLQNKEVFAGKGCKRKIDEVDRLVQEYGDSAESWMKVKANAILVDEDGEERRAEIHWYEAKESEKQEIKFKRWLE